MNRRHFALSAAAVPVVALAGFRPVPRTEVAYRPDLSIQNPWLLRRIRLIDGVEHFREQSIDLSPIDHPGLIKDFEWVMDMFYEHRLRRQPYPEKYPDWRPVT